MKKFSLILILLTSGLCYSQSFNNKDFTAPNSKDYLRQLNNQVFVSYTYTRNLGNFGNVYEYGSGIYINYGKYFPNSWLAVGRTGFIAQELRSGIDSGAYSNFKVYPLHVGGRYYVYKNIVMPYFSFMNGLNLITTSNYLGDQTIDDQTLIRYAYQVGFGFDVKFARNFGVNFNVNYNNSFYKSSDSELEIPSSMMTGFEYSGGLSYDFGN